MSVIADNLQRVQDRIAVAAQRSGRAADAVTLIAVSKTWPEDVVQQAVDAGVLHLGENRVQEALEKVGGVSGDVTWHLVGHLQRNKVKVALSLFHVIHSVDSVRLAREISRRAGQDNVTAQVLVQVNTSGEDSKFGVMPEHALDLVGQMSELPHMEVKGLMTIGAFVLDLDVVRSNFVTLRKVHNRIVDEMPGVSLDVLSMGMSNDFEVAIEEGSTMVRVGTAIFGRRAG